MILLLGGTAEARALASALVAERFEVTSSLAGRVRHPALPDGPVRIGGFGGADGLAAYLREHQITAVVDATHPFAAQISTHAVAAADIVGVPLLRLERPGWADHPDAGRWTWVADVEAARAAADHARRPLLTTGRQSLEVFLPWAERSVTARVVDPPEFAVPPVWTLLLSRGPYPYADEHALLQRLGSDVLISKDSGGSHTVAKLDAAADLGVPVVMIARPPRPGAPTLSTVAEAVTWCRRLRP